MRSASAPTGNQPLHPVHSSNTVKAIVIGGTVYQANPIPGFRFTRSVPRAAVPEAAPRAAWAFLGAQRRRGPRLLAGPNAVASVRNLGPANIDGVATTQYEVTFAPLRVCAPHQPPTVVTERPSDVWVDGAGRLLQVRSTTYFSGRLPRGEKLPGRVR